MIQFNVFPNEKRRIVTFSYDDGNINDERLIELFNSYNVKATFHLIGRHFLDIDESESERIRAVYKNHEVSCHTLRHGWATKMPSQSMVHEIIECRRALEKVFNYPIIGMAPPYGDYDNEAIRIFEMCGIVYSRTGQYTMNFQLPKKFLEWHPSCPHRNALEVSDKFIEQIKSPWCGPLLYIYGHSHDLKNENDWLHIEKILEKVSGNEEIWYATNIEIYRYVDAQRRLIISADETIFENPSNVDVWVEKDREQVIHIPAGKTIYVKP